MVQFRGITLRNDAKCQRLDMTITGKKYVDCSVLSSSAGGVAEAEDSSYDSDYEAGDSSPTPSPQHHQHHRRRSSRRRRSTATTLQQHSDVSRTSSDTLAAEFAEYVTVHGANATSQTPALPTGYTARVEFALKLGYTERLVQTALQKLGPEPAQNELLAELIRLGSGPGCKHADTIPDDLAEALLPDSESQLSQLDVKSQTEETTTTSLRPIVIDGSNVAMSHGNKEVFSCRGIRICVDWFRARGHREITVFVPKWRKEASRPDNPVVEQEILGELERERLLVFTPSRLVGGKRMVCYDDRYILRLAAEVDGVVVSNDNYRDLAQESPEFRKVVEERILMYSFVNDRFMPPDDPLGRSGPTLDNFLKLGPRRAEPVPPCPYAKKCTYGNKCKFRHPERGPHPHKSVTERLVEHAQRQLQARGPSLSLPLQQQQTHRQHKSLAKTQSWAAADSSAYASSVLKSRSEENVGGADYVHSVTPTQNNQGYPSSLGWVAPRVSNPEPEPANMHRKLQRQLTLNPSCDPRINQLRRYHQQQMPQCHPNQSNVVPLQNRQLTRLASNESSYPVSMSWGLQQQRQPRHQHVTRIASAPDSYRAWPPRAGNSTSNGVAMGPPIMSGQRLGASDTQLNIASSWPSPPQQQQQQEATRRHLHYHLANIFPDEQVRAAMALHPHETDPQQICAAILTMFPKM
ncbi:ribonuclease ZC3H12A isoform X3 [Nasonia vitripennis]|uniref:C3H1-type domain-containing protein n=1 Tax=Nasonia vitripennis TaxID=7425 RepID=A0A7M7LV55_NASVI|nr:ribonuclease ZC3H12A isoform X3 [Nasonia vitripennis]